MSAPRALLLGALLCLAALGCQPSAPVEAPDPELALRPGLSRLLPYDFSGPSPEGLRWLDNYSVTHARSASASRARYWLLRARVDWLTHAYLLRDHQERVQSLLGLMDLEGVAHPQGVDEGSLLALLEALERQAQGLQGDPELAHAATSALHFLKMMRHLDQTPTYFERLELLRQALEPLDEHGQGAFAPNALMVALADLDNNRQQLPGLQPTQYSHALARMAALPCPVGFEAYAAAEPEQRLQALDQYCQIPCEGASLSSQSPQALAQRCQGAVRAPLALFSVDNEVMLRSLDAVASMLGQVDRLLEAPPGQFPVLEGHRAQLGQRLAEVRRHLFTLGLPAHAGVWGGDLELPHGRYLPHPGVAPVIWRADDKGLTLMTHPLVELTTQGLRQGGPQALHPWAPPGQPVSVRWRDFDDPPSWASQRQSLLAQQDSLARTFEEALQLGQGSLDVNVLAPTLALPRSAPGLWLVALADVWLSRGHKAMALVVYDDALLRPGALELRLRRQAADVPVVRVDANELTLSGGGVKAVSWKRQGGEFAWGELLQAVKPLAQNSFQGTVPEVALRLSPEARYSDLVAAVAALRFTEGGQGEELRPLVEGFSLLVP